MKPARVRSVACLLTFAAASLLANAQTSVPYIGCSGDGQTGPYAAAKGKPRRVSLPPAVADQLAWYEYSGDAGHFGTLGPRGWNCFATIGSSGWTLYVAPEPMDSTKLLEHKGWKGLQGQPYSSPPPTAEHLAASKSRRWLHVCFRRTATTRAQSSRKASVPPQIIRSALFPPTTSLTRARNWSSSQRLLGNADSAQCPGFCRLASPSPASPCSPSALTSIRNCSN